MPRSRPETLACGRFIRLVQDDSWEYADRVTGTGVVAVVAVTSADQLVLTEQFRRPVGRKVIDLPAGLSGDIAGQEGEALVKAARRELFEETGFQARRWDYLFTGPSSPGMTTEMVAFFLARGAVRVAHGGGDESESIKVHVVPLARIHSWLTRKSTKKTCIDLKVFAGLGAMQNQQPKEGKGKVRRQNKEGAENE